MAELFANPFVKISRGEIQMSATHLAEAPIGQQFAIKAIETEDEEMRQFLQSLGCFEGEYIDLISVLSDTYVIHVKGARYSIDRELAEVIRI